ncbi:hypothetical protein G8770_00200 [Aestuariicella hydrocarbonica]|uniref:Uncharacterized protein n=1 Tax=Pseudomaricurvus hydrocarbonicus TaxID=1470433 RepID=A0A9E5MJG1_9GAMM|nr:hypothetical protein [Aestuariicella hydrocarbonica]NHO63967.1 hypothetical protein [Aestuariicella hydrocarbonica]
MLTTWENDVGKQWKPGRLLAHNPVQTDHAPGKQQFIADMIGMRRGDSVRSPEDTAAKAQEKYGDIRSYTPVPGTGLMPVSIISKVG